MAHCGHINRITGVNRILGKIFFDNNGNFQWSSIAAIISLVIGLISIYSNSKTLKLQKELNIKNFKGNVVSSARIQWIQEIRKRGVDFISAWYNLIRYIYVD